MGIAFFVVCSNVHTIATNDTTINHDIIIDRLSSSATMRPPQPPNDISSSGYLSPATYPPLYPPPYHLLFDVTTTYIWDNYYIGN